ncbi:MAG: nitroreductase family deazaflavin-dependent oxidoreductase [Anaerolineae bacterium]|nr:nitroreductase family deazaflavin-dependent oxidoreductase [Anaerolineae bacterium]
MCWKTGSRYEHQKAHPERAAHRQQVQLKSTHTPLCWKPRSPIALVIHTGRRSGKAYETPVIAQSVDDGFVIPLAYGTESDWYHNVLAAGGCRIRWHGQEYTIRNPQSIDAQSAFARFPVFPQKLILRLLCAQHFIKMSRQIAETPPV